MACLTPEQIELLARDAVEAGEAEELRRHVEQCDECRRKLEECLANEEALAKLKQLPESEVLESGDASPEPRETVGIAGGNGLSLAASQHAVFPGYRIVCELHRGGQGVVYKAIQESTKRKVAAKVLLHGPHASKSAKKRFEREIELVAQLKHPSIISIFHSGLTTEGLPFYAMDYVRGLPLHQYAREKSLTLEDALRLFSRVCEAVQYAHQRGVIHRDLKPSNILVDSEGVPKILDFGLAKWVAAPVETIVSITQDVLGTLPYMSPEQARGNSDEIDTRTDVYSLGVILYELLTSHYPYPVTGQMADVLKHITETPPTPPSRSWTTDSGVTRRSTRRLRPGACPIDDDVQTIIVKALAKERERRYQSAGELARDIGQYLSGEPIEAKRDSGWYVLRKQLRKHRKTAMVTGVFILVLMVATAVSTTLYVQASRARAEAGALANFLLNTLTSVDPGQARGREVTVKEMLDSAAAKIDTAFPDQPLVEAALRMTIGNTYRALGKYDSAEVHLRTAMRIRQRELGREHGDVAEALNDLAGLLDAQGEYESAEPLFREALEIRRKVYGDDHPLVSQSLNNLGFMLHRRGDYDGAESLLREALERRRKRLGDEHARVAEVLNNLAILLIYKGDYDGAEPLLKEALAIRRKRLDDDDPKLADALDNMATVLRYKEDFQGAESLLLDALAIRRKLYRDADPTVAITLRNLASVLADMGEYEAAEVHIKEALAIRRKLHHNEHRLVAVVLNDYALILFQKGDYKEAELRIREAVEMWRRMDLEDERDLGYMLETQGRVLVAMGNTVAAVPVLSSSLNILRNTLPDNHDMITCTESLLGHCLTTLSRYEQAEVLMVNGCADMIRKRGNSDKAVVERLNRIVELYEAWRKHGKADEYRAKLPPAPSGANDEVPIDAPNVTNKNGGGR